MLGSDGVISGNVVGGGYTAEFTAQVMDATGDTATRVMTIRVKRSGCSNCHAN